VREDFELLLDILDAIHKIERYVSQGEDTFFGDELYKVWVIYHLLIIGEAANHLSKTLKEQHPSVPWSDIVDMRNVLVHQYFGIDQRQIWETVQIDLPPLKKEIEMILREE